VRGRLLARLALLGLAGVRGAGTGLVRSVEAAGPLLGVRLVVVGTSPRLGRRVETRMRFAEVERPGLAGLGADAVRSGVGTGQAVQRSLGKMRITDSIGTVKAGVFFWCRIS